MSEKTSKPTETWSGTPPASEPADDPVGVPVQVRLDFASEVDCQIRAHLTRVAVRAVCAELAELTGLAFRGGAVGWLCSECGVRTEDLAGWAQMPDGRDLCPPCFDCEESP